MDVVSPVRNYLSKTWEQIEQDEREQKMTKYPSRGREEVDCRWDLMYDILMANFDGASSGYVKHLGQGNYEYACTVSNVKAGKKSKEMVVTNITATNMSELKKTER